MAAAYTATVPEGMSYVNAWYALYQSATKGGEFFETHPNKANQAQEQISTSEKVARIFQNFPKDTNYPYYMEYHGGKLMKVHFCDFPKLDVYYYDMAYGKGAAQKALDNYNKTTSDKRFDKNDSYRFSDLNKAPNQQEN